MENTIEANVCMDFPGNSPYLNPDLRRMFMEPGPK